MSSVLSVRVPESIKEKLEILSVATKRPKAWLAQEALNEYVERNAWKAAELREALAEAEKGEFISHEAIKTWIKSLGTAEEKPAPDIDIRLLG